VCRAITKKARLICTPAAQGRICIRKTLIIYDIFFLLDTLSTYKLYYITFSCSFVISSRFIYSSRFSLTIIDLITKRPGTPLNFNAGSYRITNLRKWRRPIQEGLYSYIFLKKSVKSCFVLTWTLTQTITVYWYEPWVAGLSLFTFLFNVCTITEMCHHTHVVHVVSDVFINTDIDCRGGTV
jgi:hypothetical protein